MMYRDVVDDNDGGGDRKRSLMVTKLELGTIANPESVSRSLPKSPRALWVLEGRAGRTLPLTPNFS